MKSPAPHCITETINGTLVEIYELKDGNWRARYWYRHLWNDINARRGHSWETNPWVWVISFRRVEVQS